ncbi:MAG TPA: hypothetical protein PLH94_06225, partial [Fimbriimonadaceae bacterium]|nr:hypothetical protein [Fimbriimonadaceae bacterium]
MPRYWIVLGVVPCLLAACGGRRQAATGPVVGGAKKETVAEVDRRAERALQFHVVDEDGLPVA